VQSF